MEKLPGNEDHLSSNSNTSSINNPNNASNIHTSGYKSNRSQGENSGNKWGEIEEVLSTKGQEVKEMGTEYITQSPFKSVLTAGAAGLFLGYLFSKFRA